MLTDSVLKSTLMGYGPQKASQMFHAKFQGFKRSNIHRLITSEMGHVTEEATAKGYEENEIEQYEYMATLESHTCSVCGSLDGQKFKLSERKVGVNYPLIHPYCRCTTVPYIEDLPDVTERWSRDPDTGKGKMVKDIKFNEWKKIIAKYDGPIINSQIQSKIRDSKVILDLEKAVESSPNNVKRMWKRYADEFQLDTINDDGEAFYDPSGKYVKLDNASMYATGEENVRKKYDVFFHEFGHAIDNYSGTGRADLSNSSKYGFKNALDSDFREFIRPLTEKKAKEFDVKKLENVTQSHVFPEMSTGIYDGHRIDFNNITNEAYASSFKDSVYDDLNKKRFEYRKKGAGYLEKNREFGAVSDMINAASEGKVWITMGHGKRYFSISKFQEAEAFAEMTSATINNPASLKKIKEYFPSAYEVYLKMVDDIANGGV